MRLLKSALATALLTVLAAGPAAMVLPAAGEAMAQATAPAVGADPIPSVVRPGAPTVKWATDPDDEWMGLPEGPGREPVFYTCPACHSLMLVRQQGLSRDVWEETLDWMVKEQKMDPMDPKERDLALDYLAHWFGPDRKALNRKP